MPDVLVLCEYGSLNGGERSLLAVASGLRAEGYDLQVAGPAPGPLAAALALQRLPVLPLDLHDAQGRRLAIGLCRERIRAVISAVKPDLVHANSLSMSRLSGPVTAALDVPSVGHLRDIVKITATAMTDLDRHARLLAVSAATREWYVAGGLSGDKIRVLYNGVDLERFCPRSPTGLLHRELGLPAESSLIGSIGQIGLRKGLHLLLAAAETVARTVPFAHFVIVGQRYSQKSESWDYERQLRTAAASESLRGRVHWLGVREDVDRLLNEFTLLAHAARQEPLGRVLLEAAAAGTPTVATDVGGTGEIFPPETGSALLIPPDDAESLAKAIARLLTDAELRVAIGRAARRRAEQVFDARRAAEALAAHYRDLTAGVGPSRV
ncbi:MAG: glycosyltransferase family 4 protein [Candidatus Anammoximicrobium sp.]|nr:glycosyltransferase family 4 protein [Candidatus Anammoximicrobium sp.]